MKRSLRIAVCTLSATLFFSCSSSFSSIRPLETGDLAVGISVSYKFNASRVSGESRISQGVWWGYGLGNDFDLFVTPDIIWTSIYVLVSPLTGELPYGAQSLFSLELLPPFILRKSFLNQHGASSIGIAAFSGYAGDRVDYKNIGLFAEISRNENPWFYTARLFSGYHASFRSSRFNNGFNLAGQLNAAHNGRIDKDIQYYSAGYHLDYWLYQFGEKSGFKLKDHLLIFQAENIGDQNENL